MVVGVSLALYRRYRPETFAEVIGQEHVTDPLQQALRNNRVNHAYLFSGPRGCGKTTSARILARCLNCEQGPTPTPCGECQSCRDLARNGPGSIDVIEIDAASHGGVDDARDLREKAFFGPAGSRYKIYIIDEAHMVTSAGFNALLKVVEEPPEHLKFIFATTEPEKVIGTIRSRTHHYPFRLVPPGTLRDHLTAVCEREAIQVEEGVYPLVVRAGAGSVRDSMSVMDQLLAGAGADGVTYAMATALLGYTDAALLDDVVEGFAAGDGAAVFEMVDRVIEGGHDPRRFVADLLERLRDLVIIAAVPDAVEKGLIDAPREVVERMAVQASVFGAAELSRAADLVNTGLTEMRGATSPRLQLELICARVLLPAAYDDERSTQARLERLERGVASGAIGFGAANAAPNFGGAEAAPGGVPAGPGGATAARAALGRTAPDSGQAPYPGQAPHPGQAPYPGQAPGQVSAPVPAAQVPAAQASAPAPTTQAPTAQAPATHAPVQAPAPPQSPAQPPAAPPPLDEPPTTLRPGAWPVPQGGGTNPAGPAAPRPGAWPATAGPGAPVPPPVAESAPAAPPAAPAHQPAQVVGDPTRVRQMWPTILDAVKNRRRLTWMLLFNNAQVAGFDGETLQIGFDNPGARNSFTNNGSEDVLRQAISDALGVQWRIEAIVDPSGGGGGGAGNHGGPAGGAGGFGGGPGGPGGFGGPSGGPGGPGGQGSGPGGGGSPRPPASPQPSQPPAGPSAYGGAPTQTPYGQGPGGSGPTGPTGPAALTAERPAAPSQRPPATTLNGPGGPGEPPPPPDDHPDYAPIEDDIPEDDDPDLVESTLSGHDLFIKELGATVIEEISHG
jgi:DNA polymerase-3 subunit gamma/tau